jgi:CheY-like chemotaxis protein
MRYALATIKKSGLTPEQRARGEEVIERQVAHMSRLLEDLLDVSRITRGTLELRKTHTDLTAVLEAAIEAATPILDTKRHTLTLDLPARALYLEADPIRLSQVFSNLLINAAKYTNAGGEVRVRATQEGADVVVTVKDNGIGISREMMSKVFTLFCQGASSSERSAGGLGVGLSLVRGLVTLHGGQVEAHSEGLNRGSQFTVRLPIGSGEPDSSEIHAKGTSATGAAGLKLIVLDDCPDSAETFAELLQASGHHVQTAYTGRQAFMLAETFHPHALLMDVGLPDVNGYELAQRIRATPWGRDALLIAVTGWGQETDRQRALDAGFDHHLIKPIAAETVESLLQSVRESGKLPALVS